MHLIWHINPHIQYTFRSINISEDFNYIIFLNRLIMKLNSSEDPATRNVKDTHKLDEHQCSPVEPSVS